MRVVSADKIRQLGYIPRSTEGHQVNNRDHHHSTPSRVLPSPPHTLPPIPTALTARVARLAFALLEAMNE